MREVDFMHGVLEEISTLEQLGQEGGWRPVDEERLMRAEIIQGISDSFINKKILRGARLEHVSLMRARCPPSFHPAVAIAAGQHPVRWQIPGELHCLPLRMMSGELQYKHTICLDGAITRHYRELFSAPPPALPSMTRCVAAGSWFWNQKCTV